MVEFPEESRLAKATASRRLRRPAPGKSESLVVFTTRLREDRAGVGQIERGGGRTRGGRDDGVAADGVVGRGGDGGLAAGDDGRGGREDRRGAVGRGLATKLTTPPSTGSTGLLAVTVTASGLANGVPMSDVCGVLPGTGVRVKPWLSKAPMSTAPTRPSPRWSVAGTPAPLVPASMAGLPGSRAMVWVGPP